MNAEDLMRADAFGLMTYTAVIAYLDQCILSRCPTLKHLKISKHIFSTVSIELVHHNNVRLLKAEIGATLLFKPTSQEKFGWKQVFIHIKR